MKWTKRDECTNIEDVIKRNVGELGDDCPETEIVHLREAVDRINRAILSDEQITIFGDYDADGITGAAILWATIRIISGTDPVIRLPRRFSEGYGFSTQAADEVFDGLLITVDNGISAFEQIKCLKDKGVSVIVIDHHLPSENLPDADIIIDPHSFKSGKEDFEDWCGSGLAYRVCKELLKTVKDDVMRARTLAYIQQLAAVGTVCDVVPLLRDNRKLVIDGLKSINTMPCKGLRAILNSTGTTYVDETTCGYLIGPVLNAAGRMEDDGAMLSFDVLTNCNRVGAGDLDGTVMSLISLNDRRKTEVSIAMEIARQEISETVPKGAYPIVIRNDSIAEGIVGIIAGKIAEEYRVPTFVFTSVGGGLLKGSARSYGGVHIKQMMDAAADCIERYGGHAGAAGLTVREEKLLEMYVKMHRFMGKYTVKDSDTIEYDLEIDAADIPAAYAAISKYAPFGEGNPNIVFRINKFVMTPRNGECFRRMGACKEHIKLYGNKFSAVGFGMAAKFDPAIGKTVTCVGTLSENRFRGNTEIQIEMLDFKLSNDSKETELTRKLKEKLIELNMYNDERKVV